MRFLIGLCLLLFVLLSACGTDQLSYTVEPAVARRRGVTVRCSLQAARGRNKLTMHAVISNGSSDALVAETAQARLGWPGVVFSPPVSYTEESYLIMPGNQVRFRFIYSPVNNAKLYRRIQVKGDVRRNYQLDMTFLRVRGGGPVILDPIRFSLPEQAYEAYRKAHGYEHKVIFYHLAMDKDTFIIKEKKLLEEIFYGDPHEHEKHKPGEHGDEHKGHKHSNKKEHPIAVTVTGNELLLHGAMVRFQPFHVQGKMLLYMRVLNKGFPGLVLNSTNFWLEADGKRLLPGNDFKETKKAFPRKLQLPETWKLVLGRNNRVRFTFNFGGLGAPKKIRLSTDGITTHQGKKIFFAPLVFEKKP